MSELKRYNMDTDKFGAVRAYESEHGRLAKHSDCDALRAELAALKAPAVADKVFTSGFATRPAQTEQQQPDAYQFDGSVLRAVDGEWLCEFAGYKQSFLESLLAPIAQPPADQPSDCEWCAGARHDYYGEKCQHCAAPTDGLVEALAELLDCPYVIEPATVPKAGIDAAPPYQVVGTMHVSLTRLHKARAALAAHRAGQAQSKRGGGDE